MTTTSTPQTTSVDGADGPGTEGTEVRFHNSELFPRILEEAGCSLLVSTYQAGQIVGVGVADGRLNFSFRRFDRAMGMARREEPLRVLAPQPCQIHLVRLGYVAVDNDSITSAINCGI